MEAAPDGLNGNMDVTRKEEESMEMTLRWYGSEFDTVTLKQIRQIPGVKGVSHHPVRHEAGRGVEP